MAHILEPVHVQQTQPHQSLGMSRVSYLKTLKNKMMFFMIMIIQPPHSPDQSPDVTVLVDWEKSNNPSYSPDHDFYCLITVGPLVKDHTDKRPF